jgi:hypothetical protein
MTGIPTTVEHFASTNIISIMEQVAKRIDEFIHGPVIYFNLILREFTCIEDCTLLYLYPFILLFAAHRTKKESSLLKSSSEAFTFSVRLWKQAETEVSMKT